MVPPLRRVTFEERESNQSALPHHSAPRLGSVYPHSGIAPWARREGPSMAQRGYPGIHAGMPTAQFLRSASVV
ncbi:nucleoid-structuring protein H-NS [Pseudomonas sp. PSB1]|nr:nucleoid-structuring protein H-NS [Pseudomonas sp. PSB1]